MASFVSDAHVMNMHKYIVTGMFIEIKNAHTYASLIKYYSYLILIPYVYVEPFSVHLVEGDADRTTSGLNVSVQ